MKNLVVFGVTIFGIILMLLALIIFAGCQSQPAQSATDLKTFNGQLSACVQNSITRQQADICRAQVEEQWCGDGGAFHDAAACMKDAANE